MKIHKKAKPQISDSSALNHANSMPKNRAALKRLMQAEADYSEEYPYLIQLGL